jgi:hypothetical protein
MIPAPVAKRGRIQIDVAIEVRRKLGSERHPNQIMGLDIMSAVIAVPEAERQSAQDGLFTHTLCSQRPITMLRPCISKRV